MAESMLQTSSAFSCEILQFGNMGIGRIFFRWGPLGYFSKIFPGVPEVVKFVFPTQN